MAHWYAIHIECCRLKFKFMTLIYLFWINNMDNFSTRLNTKEKTTHLHYLRKSRVGLEPGSKQWHCVWRDRSNHLATTAGWINNLSDLIFTIKQLSCWTTISSISPKIFIGLVSIPAACLLYCQTKNKVKSFSFHVQAHRW